MSSQPMTTISRPLRLLGVWPHPDDEAYLSAGLMGRVTDAGGHVTVITATRGEAGTADPGLSGQPSFASHREAELRASLGEVGVYDVRFLGFPDGGCAHVADRVAVPAIARVLAEVRPDLVVTFGPDGITGHPDHRTVGRWTTAAWADGGRRGDLLYAAKTPAFAREFAEVNERLAIFTGYGLDGPVVTHPWAVAAECALTPLELDRKRRALARHHSQTAGLAEVMGEPLYRAWASDEWFRRPTGAEIRVALGAPGRCWDLPVEQAA